MYWELWDIGSKNLVETFDSEEEGLQGVRELLAVNRPDLVDDLVLGAAYDEDEPHEIPLPPVLTGVELRAHLAETALAHGVEDTTRAVHDQIRRWLAEEGWQIQDVPHLNAVLALNVTLDDGRQVRVLQSTSDLDHVFIVRQLLLDADVQVGLSQIDTKELQDLIWSLHRDAALIGVDVDGLEPPLQAILHVTSVYFDGLTKDSLVQRILLVLRAASLSGHAIARVLDQAERPVAAAAMRRLDPSGLTSDLMSAAS